MAKKMVENQTANLTPNYLKLGITLNYLRAGGLPHIIGKLSTSSIILLPTSPQSKVSQEVMGFQSCRSRNFENFETPNLRSQDKMTFGCRPCGQAQRIL
jgi:hypothetical protein